MTLFSRRAISARRSLASLSDSFLILRASSFASSKASPLSRLRALQCVINDLSGLLLRAADRCLVFSDSAIDCDLGCNRDRDNQCSSNSNQNRNYCSNHNRSTSLKQYVGCHAAIRKPASIFRHPSCHPEPIASVYADALHHYNANIIMKICLSVNPNCVHRRQVPSLPAMQPELPSGIKDARECASDYIHPEALRPEAADEPSQSRLFRNVLDHTLFSGPERGQLSFWPPPFSSSHSSVGRRYAPYPCPRPLF